MNINVIFTSLCSNVGRHYICWFATIYKWILQKKTKSEFWHLPLLSPSCGPPWWACRSGPWRLWEEDCPHRAVWAETVSWPWSTGIVQMSREVGVTPHWPSVVIYISNELIICFQVWRYPKTVIFVYVVIKAMDNVHMWIRVIPMWRIRAWICRAKLWKCIIFL